MMKVYKDLGHVTLKTGERVQVGVVIGPDAEWAERLEKLLGHKGDPWDWQNSQALRSNLGIDVCFYVLHRQGVPFANILTAELAGVGHLGHVWTEPQDRQKGASSSLMEIQMRDFRSRRGKALFLGTGFDTVPYHMYRKFGFNSVEPESGYMAWYAASKDEFEHDYFARAGTEIQPPHWVHWPSSAALFLGDFPCAVRCAPLRLIGRQSTEGPFLPLLRDAQRRQAVDEKPRAMVLCNAQTNAVVGFTAWGRHPLWEDICLVDVYCHPSYWDSAGELLSSLPLPGAERCVAYSEAGCRHKTAVLLDHGFKQSATLKGRVPATRAKTSFLDLALFERK
jgi:hypothetical protein